MSDTCLSGVALLGPAETTKVLGCISGNLCLHSSEFATDECAALALFDPNQQQFLGPAMRIHGLDEAIGWESAAGLVVQRPNRDLVLVRPDHSLVHLEHTFVVDISDRFALFARPNGHDPRCVIYDLRNLAATAEVSIGVHSRPAIVDELIYTEHAGELRAYSPDGALYEALPPGAPFRARGFTFARRANTHDTRLEGGLNATIRGRVSEVVANKRGFMAVSHLEDGSRMLTIHWDGRSRLVRPSGENLRLQRGSSTLAASTTTDLVWCSTGVQVFRTTELSALSCCIVEDELLVVHLGQLLRMGSIQPLVLPSGEIIEQEAVAERWGEESIVLASNGRDRRIAYGRMANIPSGASVQLRLARSPLGSVVVSSATGEDHTQVEPAQLELVDL